MREYKFKPGYLNEVWKKRKGRLTKNQCIYLGKLLDEGWSIEKNTLEFIHLVYRTEQQLLPIGCIDGIYPTKMKNEFLKNKEHCTASILNAY